MSQQRRRIVFGFAIFTAALIAVAVTPLMSRAAKPETAAVSATATTVTIVNNSSREIRHVYLSATTDDNWGSDQLNSTSIAIGGSHAVSLSCGGDIKVIAEDQDGCFYYEVVSCSENSTWTINSNSARDCGN